MTVIRFTAVDRRTRRVLGPCYIATASFADGPGMKVKKITTTTDRNKAARFSLASAYEIAVQFSQYPATLETGVGAVLEAETVKVQAEQRARFAEIRAIDAELAQLVREAAASVGIRL